MSATGESQPALTADGAQASSASAETAGQNTAATPAGQNTAVTPVGQSQPAPTADGAQASDTTRFSREIKADEEKAEPESAAQDRGEKGKYSNVSLSDLEKFLDD